MRPARVDRCNCGALTVEIDGQTYSMRAETFDNTFPDLSSSDYPMTYNGCDHCVNHWGTDLCGCGSGELFGDCDNGYDECSRVAQDIEAGVVKCTCEGVLA